MMTIFSIFLTLNDLILYSGKTSVFPEFFFDRRAFCEQETSVDITRYNKHLHQKKGRAVGRRPFVLSDAVRVPVSDMPEFDDREPACHGE